MTDKWKDIWNGRDTDMASIRDGADEFAVYSRLKEMDGFDVAVGDRKAYYSSFYHAALELWQRMIERLDIQSVYEIGCGSGANLYLLKNRGIKVGGLDYSEKLAGAAQEILGKEGNFISVGEAADLATEEKWDVLFCCSVFEYFPDAGYGLKVLEKMYEKATKAVIVLEVFDKALQEECEQHRRKTIDNYDEKYKGLGKTFYTRDMFMQFAQERHSRIEFTEVDNPYYWNSRYQYNCILYKD